MKNKMKKLLSCNRGFTVAELLVVIAVMMVVYGVTSLSLGMQPASDAKKATYSIDSMITRTKIGTLAKSGDVFMEVYYKDQKVYLNYYEGNDESTGDAVLKESEVLSKTGNVKIGYSWSSDSSSGEVTLADGQSLVFAFDRNTTGFKTFGEAKTVAGNHPDRTISLPSGVADDSYCDMIYIDGGTVFYQIELYPTTGTHYPNI